jgi:superfamily II DNA or RNA helicase
MQDYIKLYEDTKLVGFPAWLVPPERMYEVLGVGVRIVDEVHQHFHVNFKMDLYTHLPKGLYLSATLESDDTFTERMYKLAYPMNTRINSGAFHKYAEVTAIEYSLQYADKVKCSRNGSYNHIVYEEWLMKKKQALANYLEMIGNIVETDYVKKRVDKQKMLIFAASVEMCRIIAEYLKKRFPKFTIGKYTSEDKYETLMTNDISVSTIGSSGTAVDIPDLITCLMTTGVVERKANLQALGRLRDLKHYPNQKVHFLYLVCTDIRKQREYHQKKLELFKPRVLVHRTMGYGRKI